MFRLTLETSSMHHTTSNKYYNNNFRQVCHVLLDDYESIVSFALHFTGKSPNIIFSTGIPPPKSLAHVTFIHSWPDELTIFIPAFYRVRNGTVGR